jgi:hypothetical protein
MARVRLAIRPAAGNSHRASPVAAAKKGSLTNLMRLTLRLTGSPFFPPTGPFFRGSGRRQAAAVLPLRRGSQPSISHDANLIAVTSADGTKADINNVLVEVGIGPKAELGLRQPATRCGPAWVLDVTIGTIQKKSD